MATTARGVALRALIDIDRGARANVVTRQMLDAAHLEARDRHLVTELVYGTCRMRRACDWLTARHVRGPLDATVRAALRLGSYQLGWTRVPSHAAVSATVDEVRGPGRSVVNAVLRRVAAEVAKGLVTWPDLATEISYPDWIVDRLSADLGREAAVGALRIMNEPATVSTRDDGYIQDPASQMITTHLQPWAESGKVLDMCAAPGGKATGLAGAELLVAGDVAATRVQVVAANAHRLGAHHVHPLVADGTAAPFRASVFDLVLVDAPCSGLGVLRRRPDARWRIQPADVDRLAALQRRLLASAMTLVRPGGVVAYSVCTLTKPETAAIDRWLAASAPDMKPLPPPAEPWIPAGRGSLLLPQAAGTDGMFLLCLRAAG
ncbi:MAG: hypothetical protein JO337_02680 [Acidimicrobiales bacterium]|nr:hypothetical protein [Acidimicrobiales bacterium]